MVDENLNEEIVEDDVDETIVEDDETIVEDDETIVEDDVDKEIVDDDKKIKEKEVKKRTQQDKIDFAFSKKQKQFQEEKRLRKEAENKNAQYKQQLQKFQQPKRPDIPEMPDMLDPQYEQKLQLREETIKAQVIHDQRLKMQQQHNKQRQQQQLQARANELKQKTNAYAERSKNFGISDEDAKKYEDSIAPFISPKNAKIAEYILDHEQGPLIVKYLSKNPMEMEKLSSMNPMNAAVYISSTIAEKSAKVKPKTSKTPAPGKTIKGKGGTTKNAALEGATFE